MSRGNVTGNIYSDILMMVMTNSEDVFVRTGDVVLLPIRQAT